MRGYYRVIIHAALGAAVVSSGAAEATMRTQPGKQKVKELSKEEIAAARTALGACVVKADRAKVTKYLANSDSVNVDYAAIGSDPMRFMFYFPALMSGCAKYNVPQLRDSVFMKAGGLRNLLLEAAYLDAAKTTPKPLLNANGEPAEAPARTFATKDDKLPAAQTFAALADCTAAKGSTEADAVLRTTTGSAEERTAAVALAPVIGTCVQEGTNISLTPATIRTIAAEGMWQRYARSPSATMASK